MSAKFTAKQLSERISQKLLHNFGVTPEQASNDFFYKAAALVCVDIMREKKQEFRNICDEKEAKTVYYLSMEFLMGRSFKNTVYNLGIESNMTKALKSFGVKIDTLYELEPDAGLGNGGLGRLAACFLDGLTNGGYPAFGYSIKYEFGIFRQTLVDGWQTEMPDFWLPGGSVWLEQRTGHAVEVQFDGKFTEGWNDGFHTVNYEDCNTVVAMPYDLMVAGKDGKAVNVLRLWSAEAKQIDMVAFNQGDYVRALERQAMSEVISKVLYPEDNHMEGKSLRLRQQYFLVSASIQDILNRHLKRYGTLDNLPEKAAIHINDTHPALVIPELMRYLLDECGYEWDKAWEIVRGTVGYTNHTVMKEALECWQVDLFAQRLPRIYSIVKEIDNRFRSEIWESTHDSDYVARTAIIENGVVRMANLSVAASHSVNGVSKLHSEILKDDLFNDYYRLTPEKFTNVTNGIAHRRWLCQANPELSKYIESLIGDGFKYSPNELEKLTEFLEDETALKKLSKIKRNNKIRLSEYTNSKYGISIDPDSIVDMQVKRLHEYKRQHLNLLNIVSEYLYIKENPNAEFTPKTYIFGAKAAPGYLLAKQIISAICSMQKLIESDPVVCDKIKIIFMEDYRVTLAELMIPAADISEQISLAGTEASGTGCMKMMLNGAVTLGTLDGANVEIRDAVGDDNIVIFGMTTPEVMRLRKSGYNPYDYYINNPKLRNAVDFIEKNLNCGDVVAGMMRNSDYYMALADYTDYVKAQNTLKELYNKEKVWNKMALTNIAKSGIFSSDRSIDDYAKGIWNAKSVF